MPKSPKKKPRKRLVRITDTQVRELRRRAKKGENTAALAALFKIHQTTVQDILAGRTRRSA